MKSAPYIAKYIEKVLRGIDDAELKEATTRKYPIALVIGPSHYLKQIKEYLSREMASVRIESSEKPPQELTRLEAYQCLLKDEESNLGWRVLSEVERPQEAAGWVKRCAEDSQKMLAVIDPELIEEGRAFLARLRGLGKMSEEERMRALPRLAEYLGIQPEILAQKLNSDDEGDPPADDPSTPIIKLTTYNGCKGLSAGFVFIVGLEAGVFPRNNSIPTDTEICQLIVGLTRTRKQCHLVTVGRFAGNQTRPSAFLNWIPTRMKTIVNVDKGFFSRLGA